MVAGLSRKLFLLLQLIFICTIPLPATDNPTVKYVGIEHGLSNNSVICTYQDYKGFMWFGTYDGLNRYDGYNFTVFRNHIGDSTSVHCNEIYSIAGDKDHNIWIGGRKGVSKYDPVKNTFSAVSYLPLNGQVAQKITGSSSNIITGTNGHVYVPTDTDGFIVFGKNSKTGMQAGLETSGGLTNKYRVTVIENNSKSQGAWMIIQNVGLCRYDIDTKTIRVINTTIVEGSSLKEDNQGNLWLGTDKALYRYNIEKGIYSSSLIDGNFKVSSICIDRKGVVWIGSDGRGVLVINAGDVFAKPFLSHEKKPLINSVAAYSIYEDFEGRKWVGTLRGGVNIIESKVYPFKSVIYGDEKLLNANNNFIQAFCEDEENNIWVGTGGGGLRYWNRKLNTYKAYSHDAHDKSTVGGNFITGLLKDTHNDIWVSSWFGGISRFNKTNGSFDHFPCYNPYKNTHETQAWLVFEDKEKRLWCSTSNDGTLYIFDRRANRFKIYDSSLVNIQCMAEDNEGVLWGGNYGALIRIDPISRKHIQYNIGYTVRSIHKDKKGNLWIGTQGGGLLHFDERNGTYKRFDEASGLRGNTILRILEDRWGHLWMSSFTGLVKMDTRNKTFRYFSKSDGLQSNQFNFNAASVLTSGEFLFGGLKGFNIFYPDSVVSQGSNPAVYLTAIRLGGHALDPGSSFIRKRTMENINTIELPSDSATLSFDFVALEYSFPDKIQYAYYLEGWDKEWNYSGQVRTANYNHISEGSYRLRIKSTNAEGNWNDKETTVKIIVLPPWYRTWWACLVYISLFALVVYAYVRYKAAQARLHYEVKLANHAAEKEKELTEKKISFFTHISHEFRTPLTLIINPIKELMSTMPPEQQNNGMSTVYRNARRLLSLVDQLLLFRKVDSVDQHMRIERLDIVEVCKEVSLSFSQHSILKNISFTLEGSNEPLFIYADREKLEIILFNLVSNSFKYTDAGGSITITILEQEDKVVIAVKDTGCGISSAVGNKLFDSFYKVDHRDKSMKLGFGVGLYVSQKLALAHQGKLSYSSGEGKGTEFRLALLKGKDHFPSHLISDDCQGGQTLLQELVEEPVNDMLSVDTASRNKSAIIDKLTSELPSMLIVDDNPEMLGYIRYVFESTYKIFEASDGAEGYQMVISETPDIVISDVMMKQVGGIELCKKIKENPSLAHIPVILLTGSSSDEIKLKGIEGGAEDYITKPFNKDIIIARVQNILRGRNRLQQYFFNAVTLKPNFNIAGEHKAFIEECIGVVENHLDDPDFNIQIFCREIGMSYPSLYKKVKSVSGLTVNVFIRYIRLKKAAELLINTDKTIVEVTYITGFNDIKYFRQQFNKLFNMNPSDYVVKYRKVLGAKQLK